MVTRLQLPPGIVLVEGEELSTAEYAMEWIAYWYECYSDLLLLAAISIVAYDALWTPCLWLLPINIGPGSVAAGCIIDGIALLCVMISGVIHGIRPWKYQMLTDFLTSVPLELIGYSLPAGRPLMWLRTAAKVCYPL